MSESIFSASWYRVADLMPRLRSHVAVSRHRYRDQLWYVLQDSAASRYHRFTPTAYFVIGLMDGHRKVDVIWDAANAEFGDEAPSQDEVIALLGELYASDALQCDVPPDSMELFRRFERDKYTKLKKRLLSPLSLRIPLVDPERFLHRFVPLVRPLMSWPALIIWAMVVGTAALLCVSHWPELTHKLSDRVLDTNNLLMLLVVFPCVKLVHELGHAFATKAWGGEVHEMGISFLVFTPVPYVDASAASAFSDKRKRIAVSAAGVMAELFLASVALFVWLNIESGVLSAVLFNIMLIGGVSTLFFNGNPLLRFDAYFILADAIEIPNLGNRAQQYLGYILQHYVFGVAEAESPVTARGEPKWFVFYGIAAFIYRLFVTFVIVLFIAGKFFLIGVLLAEFALLTQLVLPLCKQAGFLFFSTKIGRHRGRALGITAAALALLAFTIFYVPMPHSTRAEGVVWLPEHSQVRALSDGTVQDLLAAPDGQVAGGDALVQLDDPFVDTEIAVLEARRAELNAQYDALAGVDRVEAELVAKERDAVRAEIEHAREKAAGLVVRSPGAGRFIVDSPRNLSGRFVHKGELLGYVAAPPDANVRVAVTQSNILLVREQTVGVEVKLASALETTLKAEIAREVPAANFVLPSKALGLQGGGRITIDPADENGTRALEKVFQFDLALDELHPLLNFGERVHVRFAHADLPLGKQWYWFGRQLFLRHFGV